jgi:hypothetical protein
MERRTRQRKGITIDDGEDCDMERIDEHEIVDLTTKNSISTRALQAFNSMKPRVLNAFWFAFDACSIYLMWVVLHYIASHLYVYFCAPSTIVGFLYSPLIIAAPHCRGLRWVIFNGAISTDNMWLVFGTWLCSKILIPRQVQNT